MFKPEIDDAYDNVKYIPNADSCIERWGDDATAYRDAMRAKEHARLDLSYGLADREKLDLFLPAGPTRGLAVFVHGGYWRRFNRKTWSHFADGFVDRGYAAALPSYTLCPDIRVSGIARQIRIAVEFAANLVTGPIVLSGHSAGGHLVARLCCEDALPSPSVAKRIVRVVPVSGLFDLRPMLHTSINEDLNLNSEEAASESPALLRKTLDATVIAWVGGNERPAFIEQSKLISDAWKDTQVRIAEGKHHFDVIDDLKEPNSPLLEAIFSEM